ncbi:MAG: hypothetical protein U9R08_06580 [Nanoarchaeota archaeon]|nr:hypothetical protein [Nanoarchaeota archaeon]
MKTIIFILLIITIFVIGCSEEVVQEVPSSEVVASEDVIVESNTVTETIEICDSLCERDEDAYCDEKRTIILNGVEVVGTCRAFSKTGHVEGFNRCERFCKFYPREGTECEVDGQLDIGCDGIL